MQSGLLRGPPDPARGSTRRKPAGRRSGTTTWARRPTSPAAGPCLGRPLQLAGFLGWLSWLFIHIAFLTGYRNRVGAVLTWAVTFARDSRRERILPTLRIESLRSLYTPPSPRDRRTVAPGLTADPSDRLTMKGAARRLVRLSPAAGRSVAVAGGIGVVTAVLVVVQAGLLADLVARAFLGGAGIAQVTPALLALGRGRRRPCGARLGGRGGRPAQWARWS